jgi:hypothetical protein
VLRATRVPYGVCLLGRTRLYARGGVHHAGSEVTLMSVRRG